MEKKERILQLVCDAIIEINKDIKPEHRIGQEPDTVIYGPDGLDSLRLVGLISIIEDKLAETFCIEVTLASEKAFSKRSPFRTVATLTDYIAHLLNDNVEAR